MKISVIIIVYNGEEYLPELLDSLTKTKWPHGQHELIFVDNASTDNSVKIISERLDGDSYLIRLDENTGFATGNNVGIKQALAFEADYVVLLNQDTVVEPNWLTESMKVMASESEAGAVQSLLLYNDKKEIINSYGNYIHFLGFQFAGGNLTELTATKEKLVQAHEVTYASGAAVMYRAAALQEVGLLDETLVAYHEDSDICLRMRLVGYKAYLAPQSVVYHKYQFLKSEKTKGFNYKYFLMERNRQYFLLKYYNAKSLFIIFPAWLAMELGVMLFALLRGFWRERLKGYWWIICHINLIRETRKKILRLKQLNKVSDKEFMYDFVGWIDYQEIKNPILTAIGNPIIKLYWGMIRKII